MKIPIYFDTHIGYEWPQIGYDRIWEFMNITRDYEMRIGGGDIFELAWVKPIELLGMTEYRRFIRLSKPSDIILKGNHDWDNPIFPTNGSFYDITCDNGKKVRIMHGHQFDPMCNAGWKRWYYRFAPWVRDVWWASPWQDKMHDNDKWQRHNWYLWGSAAKWLEEEFDYDILVIGHTHDSRKFPDPIRDKKVLYSIGSLPEDGVYGLLDTEDGSVEIKTI